nr:hypothetical protein [Thiorhodococcus mannitoliphagus]
MTPVLLPALGALSELQIGDTLPALTLKDQHDQPQAIGHNTRFVIFTREKDASNLADDVLKGQTAETLQAIGIRYVADISKMPGLVTSMFALPKLRKYPYPVLLGRTAEETSALPREPGKVTVIEMDGGTIKALHFIDEATALRALMGLAS